MVIGRWICWVLLSVMYGCASHVGSGAGQGSVPIKLYDGPDLPDYQLSILKLEGWMVHCHNTTLTVDENLIELDVHRAVYGDCDPIKLKAGTHDISYSIDFGKRGSRIAWGKLDLSAGRAYYIKSDMAWWWPGAAVWMEDDTGAVVHGSRKLY